ncbi:hypothetical protein VaNZ11_007336 [Volvox africanus]|uniref:HMG box domain-containing protein n=1 Tax=Volvox africanus TaxID=51714 RepID=A0ABQ5S390_9CHLO|nr:hypothetical protein VaNZ11_007336 [Volvox africanus]
MTSQVPRKLKPTGGVKVDHASANREFRQELEGQARSIPNEDDQAMDATIDADLVDVLGEIEGLVAEEGDIEAQIDDAFGDALDKEEDGVAPQEVEPNAQDAAATVDGDIAPDAILPSQEDGVPDANVDDGGDLLAEVDVAAQEPAGSQEDMRQAGAETEGRSAEATDGTENPAEADAIVTEAAASPVPAPSIKKAAPKPDIAVPKAPVLAAAPLVARKGLLPPVRKAVAVAPAIGATAVRTATAAGPAVKAAVGAKPASGGLAVKAAPVAKAATGNGAVKSVTIGKPAAAKAKPTIVTATSKPAAAGAVKAAAASSATPAAVAKPPTTAKPTTVATATAKLPTAAAVKTKAATSKVIQARLVPADQEEDEGAAAVVPDGAKIDATAPPAKRAKKAGQSANTAGDGGKKGAPGPAASGAAAKKRVVMVGSKSSAAFDMFKAEHKQQLIDAGTEAAEAAEQTLKDWAALGPAEKAEYEERAKEQGANDDDGEPAAAKLTTRHPKAPKAPKGDSAQAGPKYYTNGYMLFLEERRPDIVAGNPEASFADVGKLLGAEWRGLGKDEQEEYNKRAKALNAESGAQPKPRKSKAKDEPGAKAAGKTCSAKAAAGANKGSQVATAARVAGKGSRKVAAAGQAEDCHSEDGLMELAVAAADGMEIDGDCEGDLADAAGDGGARQSIKRSGSSSRKRSSGGGGRKGRQSSKARKAEAEAEAGEAAPQEDSSDESDREDVDWEAHPAEAILAKTSDGRYLVKRAGLGLDEYGIVNGRAVKRQRLNMAADGTGEQGDGEDVPSVLPVSIEMVDEFEAFERSFWASVQDRSDGGDLDLDDLGENSPLELCYYLGKLREDRMALHSASIGRRDKDTMIRVPALRLSMAVQRVLMLERQRVYDLVARLSEAEAKLAQYEGVEVADEAVEEGQA